MEPQKVGASSTVDTVDGTRGLATGQPQPPGHDVPQVDFTTYSTTALDGEIQDSIGKAAGHAEGLRREVITRLLPALREMEKRYAARGARNDLKNDGLPEGWQAYCRSRGLNPDTIRKWFQRYEPAKEVATLVGAKPKTATKPASKNTVKRVDDTEADLIATAGVRLANTLIDPLLPEKERIAKATRLAEELKVAVEGGGYESIAMPEQTVQLRPWKVIETVGRNCMVLMADTEPEALGVARRYGFDRALAQPLDGPMLLIAKRCGNRKSKDVFTLNWAVHAPEPQERTSRASETCGLLGNAAPGAVKQPEGAVARTTRKGGNSTATFTVGKYGHEFAVYKDGKKPPYEIHATSEEAAAHAAQLERECRDATGR